MWSFLCGVSGPKEMWAIHALPLRLELIHLLEKYVAYSLKNSRICVRPLVYGRKIDNTLSIEIYR